MRTQTNEQLYERAVQDHRAAYAALKAYCERMEAVLTAYPGNDLWMSVEYDAVVERLDVAEVELHNAYERWHEETTTQGGAE